MSAMGQIMIAHLKGLLRNKILLFWALGFPLILTTLISFTVAKAYTKKLELNTIPIAIVKGDAMDQDKTFRNVLESVSQGEDALFEVRYVQAEEAKTLLQDDDIIAYVSKQDEALHMTVKDTGIEATILKSFVDEYEQKVFMIQDLMMHGASYDQIQASFENTQTFIEEQGQVSGDVGDTYYYAILAMTMLYGGYWALRLMHNQRADRTTMGQRNALAPTPKTKMLLADFLVSMFIHLSVQLIVLLYMKFVLGANFGDHLAGIMMLIVVGSIAGHALGVVVSLYGPKTFDGAQSLLTTSTLLSCTMAGMMYIDIKYLIDTNAPWLAAINPATLITDAFYAQVYYGMGERYFTSLVSLLIFAFICYTLTFVRLRRKQYASL